MDDDELSRIAQGYRTFVDEAAPSSPLYARLAADVADDPDILQFLAALPVGKRQPNLLLAAVQYLHGTPADGRELRGRVVDDGVRLRTIMTARATQTNEPARCAALLPVLARLDGPLALVEVGASAGLCLYPDRYSYEFDGRPVGPRSAVHLTCATTGGIPLPGRLPDVVARIGIDLNPLDPTDPDDRAWLRALVWPGPYAEDRLRRLRAAAELAGQEPPRMLSGDLVDRLPDAIALVPPDCTVVVFHTAVLPYVPPQRRSAFIDLVRSLPVLWLAQEAPGVVPGTGETPPGGWGNEFVLSLDGRPLARTAPHGGRVDWLPGAREIMAG
jgi:hypothetical protein